MVADQVEGVLSLKDNGNLDIPQFIPQRLF